MEQLTTARENNRYISDYIKVSDAKIAGFISISTAISAAVLPSFYKWLGAKPVTNSYILFWGLLILGTLFFLGTLICCLNALSPRVDTAKSLVSFPDIAKMNLSDYQDAFKKLTTDDAILMEYLKHNKALSDITLAKFKWLKKATTACYVWITIYVFLFIIYGITALN
ncbi:MAG: Pycsar system effector family protein [Bdellovibrionota bacterium]